MDEPKGPDTSGPEKKDAAAPASKSLMRGGGRGTPPPPPVSDPDEEEGGMLRMSFLEHLEELRSRLIKMLVGFGVIFMLCMLFAQPLWLIVQAPAADALKKIGHGQLVAVSVMEQFSIIYIWTPVVAAIFLGSPWILYQIWAFIAPGLYKRERKWAVPFVLITAGLFISGGIFAYFVAFRYALVFLLGLGSFGGVTSMVSIESYFETFVDVMLGVSLVFEMPVLIFFLTLLRLASPSWLLANSRYAILVIVIIAAIVTPTPDAFTMTLLAVPMCLLYFVGVFAGYLLVMRREGRSIPWKKVLLGIALILIALAGFVYLLVARYHFHLIRHWPFLVK